MATKICSKCGIEKDKSEFHKDKRKKDGLRYQCKECRKTYTYIYYNSNRNKIVAKSRKNYNKYRKELNAKSCAYNAKHKKERALYKKKHREKFPEKEQANNVLTYAITTNKIIRSNICSNPHCDCSENIEGHHWSYLPENRLDVIWCCRSCHKRLPSANQNKTREIDWSLI